jgi:hypothetical protein
MSRRNGNKRSGNERGANRPTNDKSLQPGKRLAVPMAAWYPEEQSRDEQLFLRTYKALQSSEERLSQTTKLLQRFGAVSKITDSADRNCAPAKQTSSRDS